MPEIERTSFGIGKTFIEGENYENLTAEGIVELEGIAGDADVKTLVMSSPRPKFRTE